MPLAKGSNGKTALSDIEPKEISLVDKGANGKKLLIVKAAGEGKSEQSKIEVEEGRKIHNHIKNDALDALEEILAIAADLKEAFSSLEGSDYDQDASWEENEQLWKLPPAISSQIVALEANCKALYWEVPWRMKLKKFAEESADVEEFAQKVLESGDDESFGNLQKKDKVSKQKARLREMAAGLEAKKTPVAAQKVKVGAVPPQTTPSVPASNQVVQDGDRANKVKSRKAFASDDLSEQWKQEQGVKR